MSSEELVLGRHLSRRYRSNGAVHPAVRDVSLTLTKGDFVALMGPSGCGKSTLLNLLGGIDRPDEGEVWVAGQRVDRLTETQLALFRRRHVGLVFQFFNLVQNLDVLGNVELPGLLTREPAAAVRRRAMELLEALEIADLRRQLPEQLSGGQRQRTAIARALINRPTLLLADEPTGALDRESGEAVLAVLRQFHAEGQTILMVTHDARVAGHAERVLYMQDGRLGEETGTAAGGLSPLAARLVGVGGTGS